MSQYEFQSILYPTLDAMLGAIAAEWLTAGGSNSSADVAEALATTTDEALAAECIQGWGFGEADDEFSPSPMERDGWTADDLAAAFADLRGG